MQLVRHEARRVACLEEDGQEYLSVFAGHGVARAMSQGVLDLDVPVSPAEQL